MNTLADTRDSPSHLSTQVGRSNGGSRSGWKPGRQSQVPLACDSVHTLVNLHTSTCSKRDFYCFHVVACRRGLALKGKGDIPAAIESLEESLQVYADQPRTRDQVCVGARACVHLYLCCLYMLICECICMFTFMMWLNSAHSQTTFSCVYVMIFWHSKFEMCVFWHIPILFWGLHLLWFGGASTLTYVSFDSFNNFWTMSTWKWNETLAPKPFKTKIGRMHCRILPSERAWFCAFLFTCTWSRMYVCVCVFIYTHIPIYTYVYT